MSTLRDQLERLHSRQTQTAREALARITATQQLAPENLTGLAHLGELSNHVMKDVICGFGDGVDTGSWIAGRNLPLQLLSQQRLTVDLTLAELQKDPTHPFGMSVESLGRLAKSGYVHINLRDYDDDASKDLRGHLAHEATVMKLLESAEGHIYFGSAVRKPVFDWAAGQAYETFFQQAGNDIWKHGTAVAFRGRGEPPVATFWHWAYLRAVERLLPAGARRMLHGLYEAMAGATDEVDAKARFVELARGLRLMHLNFTASITASFGTTYNMTDEEYRDSANLRVHEDDVALCTPTQDETAFLAYLFANSIGKTEQELAELCSARVELKDGADTQALSDDTIGALIRCLDDNEDSIRKARSLLQQMWSAYLADGQVPELGQLIQDYRSVRNSAVGVIEREKSLERIFRVSATAGAAAAGGTTLLTTLPWVVSLAAASPALVPVVGAAALALAIVGNEAAQRGAAAAARFVVPKILLRPKRYRLLYRVHKVVASSRS